MYSRARGRGGEPCPLRTLNALNDAPASVTPFQAAVVISAPEGPALSAARVCVAPASSVPACSALLAGVAGADLSCVGAADEEGCIKMVAQGTADLAVLQGEVLQGW